MADASTTPAPRPEPAAAAVTLQPGEKVDHYVVIDRIGHGGQAVVFQAHDPLLDRFVAIKQVVLSDRPDADDARLQAREQAQLHKRVADTDPRHLVQLIDVLDTPRGLMIITEFVEGESLEQRLADRRTPLPLQDALGYMAGIAMGLRAMHKRQVLHRDLKPSNILLGKDGSLKLTDFGLAATLADQEELSIGTVRYMSPELLQKQPADQRADLYALGMVAYEMLAGREGFEKAFKSILRDQRHQDMRWLKWHTNPRTRATPIEELNSDVPEDLAALVHGLLEKDPDARPRTAGDVVRSIRRHVTGEPATAESGGGAAPAAGAAAGVGAGGAAPATDTAPLPRPSRALMWALVTTMLVWVTAGTALAVHLATQKEDPAAIQAAKELELKRQRYNAAKAFFVEGMSLLDQAENDLTSQSVDRRLEGKNKLTRGQQSLANAVIAFTEELDDWPEGSPSHQKLRAGIARAEAEQLMLERDWGPAIAQYRALMALPDDARAEYDEGVGDKVDYAEMVQNFETARSEIATMISRERWNDARIEIGWWKQHALRPEESRELNALEYRIEQLIAGDNVRGAEQYARKLAETDPQKAIAWIEDTGLEYFPDSPVMTGLLRQLKDSQAFRTAEAKAVSAERAAVNRESVADAIRAWQDFKSSTRDQQVWDRADAAIARLRVKEAWFTAQDLMADGRGSQARRYLEQVIQLDPESKLAKQAQAAIDGMAQAEKIARLKRAGQNAYAAGNWDDAITQFAAAIEAGGDAEEIGQQVKLARLNILSDEVDAAIEAGDYGTAQQKIDQARGLGIGDDDRVARKAERLDALLEISGTIKRGDDFVEQRQWRSAKLQYRAALELLKEEADKGRLTDAEVTRLRDQAELRQDTTEFEQIIDRVRGYIQANDFTTAKAMLGTVDKLGRELGRTDEVEALRKRIDSQLP